MKGLKQAFAIILIFVITLGTSFSGHALADNSAVLEQEQTNLNESYFPGDALISLSESEILSEHSSLTADGISETTVTVKLKDEQGNAITTGGASVEIFATLGTVSPVTDNQDGTYSATLTAPEMEGIATISASIDGNAIVATVDIQFVASVPALTNRRGHQSSSADETSQTTGEALSAQEVTSSEPDEIIRVEADKFVDAFGAYPDGLDGHGIPNLLIVGYARDQGGDYGAANTALRFDLNNLINGKKIQSATLKIYVSKVERTGGDTPFIDLWGSYDDNWNDDFTPMLPTHNERIVTNDSNVRENDWKSFDVTDFIVSQLPDKKATFVLRGGQTAPPAPVLYQPQIFFFDKMNWNFASRLEITYIKNSPPTNIQLTNSSITENNNVGDTIGTLSVTDPDQGDTVTYSTTPGTSSLFTVEGNQLKANQSFNYERLPSQTVSIRATDSVGNTLDQQFDITIINVNEPPTTATVSINDGLEFTSSTSVSIKITHDDPDAAKPEYRLTNETGDSWSDWKPYESTVLWNLSAGDGFKTVYMELRDGTGTILKAQDSIWLDTTPPVVTGVINGGQYKENVTIVFNEGTATLNGSPFGSGTIVSFDWNYNLRVTDMAGNVTSITFTIDKMPPTGSITINGGAGYTNKQNVMLSVNGSDIGSGNVQMSFSQDNVSWTSFEPFLLAKPFTLTAGDGEKTVYMKLKDGAGNISFFEDKIKLDTIPPMGTIVINDGHAATSLEKVELAITASDANGPVEVMLSNDNIFAGSWMLVPVTNTLDWLLASGDGVKTVFAKFRDGAGNEHMASDIIVLDKTPPIVIGVTDGSFYTTDVAFIFNEGIATLNGKSIISGTLISEEGNYTLIVKDAADNTTTITFTIDKSAPTGSLMINNGATHTNSQDVTLQISVNDAINNLKMRFSNDNTTWSALENIATSKTWRLTAGDGEKIVYMQLVDEASNTLDLQSIITLDTAPPIVTGVENNKLYNQNVKINFNEGSAVLNGKTIADGEIVSEDGTHTLIITDEAGNSNTLQFFMDQSKPTGSLKINNGADFTNTLAATLQIAITDASNELEMRFSHDTSDISNWSPWESLNGTKAWKLQTGDGVKHVYMEVKDKAGNFASFRDEIILDMTNPKGSIEINQGQTKTNQTQVTVGIKTADDYKVEMRLSNDNLTWSEWKEAPSQGEITWDLSGADGIKTVYMELKDQAGNQIALRDEIILNTKISLAKSEISSAHSSLTADGSSQTTITVRLKDAQGNVLKSEGAVVAITSTLGTVSAVTDHKDGTYTAKLSAPTAAGTATISGRVYGDLIQSTVTVKFVPQDNTESPNPGSGTNPENGTSPSHQSSSNTSSVIRINDIKLSGISTFHKDANGVKSTDILLGMDTLKKVLNSLPAEEKNANLTISVDDNTDQIALRLPGEVVKPLADKSSVITLKSTHGQYRLPLAAIANQETDWMKGIEAQVTIKLGKRGAIPELQDAANKGGFQLVSDPVHFGVHVMNNGQRREISSFNSYVEQVIYLPKEFAGSATTVIVWDQKLGVRPVPTEFKQVDGQQAAVIRSLNNGVYALVSKKSVFTDIQGHWAASEIHEMNSRMIVHGVDESRFVPEAEVTRAELAAMVVRALGLPETADEAGFQDVGKSSWYNGAVAAVKAYGIMNGSSDGTFDPDREVSRQEAIATIVRAMQLVDAETGTTGAIEQIDLSVYTDSEQIADWAQEAMRVAINEELVKGYGDELRPQKSLTRAETAALIYRMLLKAELIDG